MPSSLPAILQFWRTCRDKPCGVVNVRPQYLQQCDFSWLDCGNSFLFTIGAHGVFLAKWSFSRHGLVNTFKHFEQVLSMVLQPLTLVLFMLIGGAICV
jgi:hypothetical protein